MRSVYKTIEAAKINSRYYLNNIETKEIISHHPDDRGYIALDAFKLGYVRGQRAERAEQKKAMETGDQKRDARRRYLEYCIAEHSKDDAYLNYLYMHSRAFEEVHK